jgi:hypothetical protein
MAKSLKLDSFISILFLTIALAAITLGSARVSWADSLGQEMQEYHRFLHNHPRIAADLERSPGLASDPRYLNDHDNLRQFLRNHPRVRQDLVGYRGSARGRPYAWDRRGYDDRRYDEHRPHDWWWGRR